MLIMSAIYYASKYYSSVDILEDWITRLSRLNTVAIEAACAQVGMTASEMSVLGMLTRAGTALSPTRLQVLVIQSPGGLTKTLRRLETSGYVRRRPDPDDRRSLLVHVTAAGKRASDRVSVLIHEHYAQVLSGTTDAQRRVLTDLVRKLIDELETMSGQHTIASGSSVNRSR